MRISFGFDSQMFLLRMLELKLLLGRLDAIGIYFYVFLDIFLIRSNEM